VIFLSLNTEEETSSVPLMNSYMTPFSSKDFILSFFIYDEGD